MRNIIKLLYAFCMLFILTACEKNDPITELGETNGQYAAQLRVTYSTRTPAIGDTVTITAATWQKDDKIAKVQFNETLVQRFGIKLTLNHGSSLATFDDDNETLIIVDTLISERPWITIENSSNQLDSYYVTHTNNYVIEEEYPFVMEEGNYPNDATLLSQLDDDSFRVLKSLLAYTINREDYLALFPTADDTHFTNGGTYVLSQTGINNLRTNLTMDALTSAVKELSKTGVYQSILDVHVVTPTGATTSTSNTFETSL